VLDTAGLRSIALVSNRNFELRRESTADLDAAPISVTSVLNGAFADMLTGTAPMIAFGRRKILYWSAADQILDFTIEDDVARGVALVALDADAPGVVEIAGDRVAARGVARTMSELTGTPFKLQFAGTTGTTGTLSLLAKAVRRFAKSADATFPAWQGMQYFASMSAAKRSCAT
jgi:nucleoside-diphosphate-sugar epimerase